MQDIGRDVSSGTSLQRVVLPIHKKLSLSFDSIDDMLPRVSMTGCKTPFAQGKHPHDVIFPPLLWTYEHLFGDFVGRGTIYLLFFNLITM